MQKKLGIIVVAAIQSPPIASRTKGPGLRRQPMKTRSQAVQTEAVAA